MYVCMYVVDSRTLANFISVFLVFSRPPEALKERNRIARVVSFSFRRRKSMGGDPSSPPIIRIRRNHIANYRGSHARIAGTKTSLSPFRGTRGTAHRRDAHDNLPDRKLPKIGKPSATGRSFPPLNPNFDSIFRPPLPLCPRSPLFVRQFREIYQLAINASAIDNLVALRHFEFFSRACR